MELNAFNFQAIAVVKTGKIPTRRVLMLGLMVGLAVLSTASMNIRTAHANKPAPPPAPSPVKYKLSIVLTQNSVVEDMNNFGELAGWSDDSSSGRLTANVILNNQVIQLGSLFTPPAGWYFRRSLGINDEGSIVGTLGQNTPDPVPVYLGFVIHPEDWPSASNNFIGTYGILPHDNFHHVFPKDINDGRLVVASYQSSDLSTSGLVTYDSSNSSPSLLEVIPDSDFDTRVKLNNPMNSRPAQFTAGKNALGLSIRHTFGTASSEVFNLPTPFSLNDFGTFCGGVDVLNRKGQPTGKMMAYRKDVLGYQQFPATNNFASAINSNGDMAIPSTLLGVSCQLYSEGRGVLTINDLLVGISSEIQLFKASRVGGSASGGLFITERGSLNAAMPSFPALGGYFTTSTGINYAFILTPVAP